MEISKRATTKEMKPRRAVELMLRLGSDLTDEERIALRQICHLHPYITLVHALLPQFAQMLRDRRGEELDQWLQAAFQVGIPELRAFVNKLRQDQQAVQAGHILK